MTTTIELLDQAKIASGYAMKSPRFRPVFQR